MSSTQALPSVASPELLAAVSEPAFVLAQCLQAWNAPVFAGLEHLLVVAGYAAQPRSEPGQPPLPAGEVLDVLGEVYHFAYAARQALGETLPELLRKRPVRAGDTEPDFELSAAVGPYSQFYVTLAKPGSSLPSDRHVLFARRSGKYESGQRLFSPTSEVTRPVRTARSLQALGEHLVLCELLRELSMRARVRVGQWPLLGETGMDSLDAAERAQRWWRPRYDKACDALNEHEAAAQAYAQKYFGALSADEFQAMFERTGVDVQTLSDELKRLLGRRPQRDNIHQMLKVLGRRKEARAEHAELLELWVGS